MFLNRPRFGGGHSQPADLASQPCNGDVFWYAHTIVVGKGGSARGMLQKSAEKHFVMIRDDSEVCLNSEVGFLESGIRPIIHL